MATALKNLLSDIFKNQSWKYDLLRDWNKIMGPLSQKVSLEKIYNDTLILGVTNSCWMQELYLLSSVIIKTINQNLDKPRIKQLRFKKIGKQKKVGSPKVKEETKTLKKPLKLTVKQRCALEHIKDAKLKSALESFLKRCHGEKQ